MARYAGKRKRKTQRRAEQNVIILSPFSVLFTQNTIYSTFTDGGKIEDTIRELVDGETKPNDIPYIRVREHDGNWYTLDNRRLYCFQQAKVEVIKCENVTHIQHPWEFFSKNQNTNGGRSVRVINRNTGCSLYSNI